MISKEVSTKLKGLAIGFVLLGHVLNYYFGADISTISSLLGTGGVWIFLILSGYGLFSSYAQKGIQPRSYCVSKWKHIFLPYALVTLVYYIYMQVMGKHLSIGILLKNIICLDFERNIDGTMWYMSFLFIWYTAFLIVFLCKIPDWLKIGAMFVIGYVFATGRLSAIWNECNWQFSVNAYAFPIGVFLGYLGTLVKKKQLDIKWKLVSLISSALLYVAGVTGILNFSYGQYGVLLFVLCWMCMEFVTNRFMVLGKHSYFIYLIEGKCITILSEYNSDKYPWMFVVFFLIGIILLTLIYESITRNCVGIKNKGD